MSSRGKKRIRRDTAGNSTNTETNTMEDLGNTTSPPTNPKPHSLMVKMNARDGRRTTHHAAKQFQAQADIALRTIAYIKEMVDDIGALKNQMIQKGTVLHQLMTDNYRAMYSTGQQQIYRRSAELEQFRAQRGVKEETPRVEDRDIRMTERNAQATIDLSNEILEDSDEQIQMNNQPTLDMLTTGQTITGNVLSTATTTATGGTVSTIGLPLKPYFNYLRNILAKEIVDLKLRDRPIKT